MTTVNNFFNYKGIATEDIPSIPLYMDQLLNLFDDYFNDFKRQPEEKVLTKTMINNYVKSKLVSPPVKKKYTKDQLMTLALVYQLKNILPINDIKDFFDLFHHEESEEEIIQEITERYFKIYNAIAMAHLKTLEKRSQTLTTEKSLDGSKREFIARLLIEADLNKRLAQLLIDEEQLKKY